MESLTQLRGAVEPPDQARLDELHTRLADRRLRVLVVGEAKRGKSTLVNALLGTPLLPTGVTPLTAVPTAVRFGEPARLAVTVDGRVDEQPLTALADLVTERGNPGNRRGVTAVTAYLPAPLLAGGVEIVDTPGVGSVFAHNTREAAAALDTMDAAVFVLTADPPISATEKDLLRAVADRSVALFVVLNKIDTLNSDELAEVTTFTAQVVAETVRPDGPRPTAIGNATGLDATGLDARGIGANGKDAGDMGVRGLGADGIGATGSGAGAGEASSAGPGAVPTGGVTTPVGAEPGAGFGVYQVSARRALTARRRTSDEPAYRRPDAQPASTEPARAESSGREPGAPRDGDGGLTRLEDDLLRYLAARAGTDLVTSVARHAYRIAARYADAATVTVRAAQLAAEQATDRVAAFRGRLDAVDEHRRDAVDVVRASVARLLADLNDAARWETPQLTEQVRAAVSGYLRDQPPGLPAGQLERGARDTVEAATRHAVDGWRHGQQQALQRRLTQLDARLTDALGRELDQVRVAARDLLGVDLALAAPTEPALPDGRFSYSLGPEIGLTAELGAVLRRWLPRPVARRMVVRNLAEEADLLAGKQVGRARAAFQQALGEAQTAILRAVDRRYTEAVAGLVAALDAASALADTAGTDADARRASVTARLDTLRAVMARLEPTARDTG